LIFVIFSNLFSFSFSDWFGLYRFGALTAQEACHLTAPKMQTKRFLGLNGTKLQIAIGFLAGMDFLLFGYDQGVTGGLLTLTSFNKYFPSINTLDSYTEGWTQAEKNNQSTRQGITVAAYNLGCFAGSIPTIWIGNILGRRKAIFLGSFIMCIGAILQCTSYGLAQLVVGRLVTGFGRYQQGKRLANLL
jgi:hypothetical protein